MWATSVPILVYLGLSVLNLGPMYATDRRQTDVRCASSLNAPAMGRGHNNWLTHISVSYKRSPAIISAFWNSVLSISNYLVSSLTDDVGYIVELQVKTLFLSLSFCCCCSSSCSSCSCSSCSYSSFCSCSCSSCSYSSSSSCSCSSSCYCSSSSSCSCSCSSSSCSSCSCCCSSSSSSFSSQLRNFKFWAPAENTIWAGPRPGDVLEPNANFF